MLANLSSEKHFEGALFIADAVLRVELGDDPQQDARIHQPGIDLRELGVSTAHDE